MRARTAVDTQVCEPAVGVTSIFSSWMVTLLTLAACGGVEGTPRASQATEARKTAWETIDAAKANVGENGLGKAITSNLLPVLPGLAEECAAGSGLACWMYDRDYELVVGVLKKDDLRAVAQGFCTEQRNGPACAAAAQALDNPTGVGGNPIEAVAGLMTVCNQGLLDACARAAGIRIGSGLEMEALDHDTAKTIVERACDKGILHACALRIGLMGAITREESNNFDRTSNFRVLARACALGESCSTMLYRLRPEEPFGCSLCDADSFDERCMQCEAAQCYDTHCRSPNVNPTHACCSEESEHTPRHPDQPEKRSRIDADRILGAAKRATTPARTLFKRGCSMGHKDMCLVEKLDREIAKLKQWLDNISAETG